jgi:hypothetical protein
MGKGGYSKGAILPALPKRKPVAVHTPKSMRPKSKIAGAR